MRSLPSLSLLLVLAAPLHAQRYPGHSYLPIEHWATPLLEHLIDRGALQDPSPMLRPWLVSAVATALARVDTAQLTGPERRSVATLADLFRSDSSERFIALEGEVQVRTSTHARRAAFALREEGSGRTQPQFGANLTMQFGPGLILMHPQWDKGIDHDPDFGGIDRPVKVRFLEAYAAYRSEYLDIDVGAVSRNWGPVGMPGLLVSPWPLSYDSFFFRIGPPRVYLTMLVAQLDNLPNNAGIETERYFVAHRLAGTPWDWISLAIWEGQIISGPGRSLELWNLNPFRVHFQTRDEKRTVSNVWVGGDGEIRAGRVRLSGSLTIDDIQLFNTPAKNEEPTSFALTATMSFPVGPTTAWIGYSIVSNLMYRTTAPDEAPLVAVFPGRNRIGTGLARSFSDYDQASLRIRFMPLPNLLVAPELTFLRQGEGDLRLPFPPRDQVAGVQTIFDGVIERTWRLALQSTLHLPLDATALVDVGVHRIFNADHIEGQTRTRFVGTFTLRYAFGGRLPL